jgi:hypothetical protein
MAPTTPRPPPPPVNTTQSQSVSIGGVQIKIATTAYEPKSCEEPLFKKESRAGLTDEKKNELFKEAVTPAKGEMKFELMPVILQDENKLKNTYDLELKVDALKNHHIMYDMHDVFTIVVPDPTNSSQLTGQEFNLYTSYTTLTLAQIAASNRWYFTWPDGET